MAKKSFYLVDDAQPIENNIECKPVKQYNYFNYYTEIEEAFVARRGSPMMISPLDWSLVESWKTANIPLHIVLRGIAQSFNNRSEDTKSLKSVQFRKINTLFYCQQSVMTEFSIYGETQIGASEQTDELLETQDYKNVSEDLSKVSVDSPFSLESVQRYLIGLTVELEKVEQSVSSRIVEMYPHLRLREALERATMQLDTIAKELPKTWKGSFEKLEQDLTRLEKLLYDALCADVPPEILQEATREASIQLKPHKNHMDTDVYKQTVENYRARQLRLKYCIPRLSLFYLRPD